MNPRIGKQPFEVIDRTQLIPFSFGNKTYTGFRGDVITSALWANGVRLTGRSFNFHRPRGSYSVAGHDANAVFTDGHRTNLRGDLTPLEPGMRLTAVNTVGGLRHDVMRAVGRFSRLMPVGFYYRAFFKPRWLFPFYERQMRRAAGLGRINRSFPPTESPNDYAWCDVLVVGAGAAGLTAALTAAQTGLRVMLVDDQPRLGGSLLWQQFYDSDSSLLVHEQERELRALPNVEIRTSTTAGGHFADNWIALFDDRRMTKVRARTVIYANGAIEQPAVFGDNDVPGVILASAAQRLIRLYAIKPFGCAVVMACNPEGYMATLDLLDAGVEIAGLADPRPEGEDTILSAQVRGRGVQILRGYVVYETMPNPRGTGVAAVLICPCDRQGRLNLERAQALRCDGIVVSVGWMPNASLLTQAGVRFAYDENRHQPVPFDLPDGIFAAGRVNGLYTLPLQAKDGMRAGEEAARLLGKTLAAPLVVRRAREPARTHPYPIFEHPRHTNFVDLDADLRLIDLVHAHQEGYDSFELLQRYSTLGMGPSQGKLANLNAVRILAKLNGDPLRESTFTTARPYQQPVPLGHLAGRRFHPTRRTPLHDWHQRHDAVFFSAGEWYRPEYYRRPGESRADSIFHEAQQVRQKAGLIDLGTLGKLFVQGPDAASFLERLYTGRFENLAVGHSRYGVAVEESGVVFEDGVIARLAVDRFYVTTTSSGAASMYREMLRWALVWKLRVSLVNATGQFAAMNLAGPHSREILQGLVDGDLSPAAFPYQALRECRFGEIPLLLLRVGCVGEWGYEIHVPAWHAAHVWQTIAEAGRPFALRPFGVEAQRLLRLEKGHVIITHDTDDLTHPYEVGLGPLIAKNKPFFVGQRSLQIIAQQPLQRQLVGIRWPDGYRGRLPDECHLIIHKGRIAGRVTSIAPRSNLGHPLGLAFVEPALAAPDTPLAIRLTNGALSHARVAQLPFYDPENLRQKTP